MVVALQVTKLHIMRVKLLLRHVYSICSNELYVCCSKSELQMMKKGAFLINYARGDVVDKQVSLYACHEMVTSTHAIYI